MKKIINIFVGLLLMSSGLLFAQPGTSCDQANCTEGGTYPSITGQPSMGQYGCLYSTPNPYWIAVQVTQAGNIAWSLTQNSDIDFAAYGPFPSIAAGCPIGPGTPQADCSYSATSNETININNVQPGQFYIILITNFSGSAGNYNITPLAGNTAGYNCNGVTFSASSSMTPATCGQPTGSVTATPNGGFAPYTYSWNIPGNPTTATVNNVAPGTYTCTVTSAADPQSGAPVSPTTTTITVTNQAAAYTSSTTPATCAGSPTGTATINTTVTYGTVSYLWNDPAGQTTQTATGLLSGNYTCTVTTSAGCSNVINVTVGQLPGITGSSAPTHVTCNSGNNGSIQVTISQGTPPYTYVWDNSPSTTNVANNLTAGPYMVTVTDQNGCSIDFNNVITEPAPLAITSLTPSTQICPEDDILLSVTGTGGSSTYTFTWFENGTQIGTGTSITVDPEYTNTQYCVELSEACGSPVTQECTNIYFPTPIQPLAIPDEIVKCVPDTFYFQNASSNGSEIATTHWDYGYKPMHNEVIMGNANSSHYYDLVGKYTLILTTTSIYGCVYSDTFPNIIEVKPVPTANFTFSANPATIFETTVNVQDASSSDVIQWTWSSPGSNPSTSNSENPSFTFPEGIAGTYPVTLSVMTNLGCTDTVQYMMTIIEDIIFYAPNSFTPNGDNHNQTWKPVIQGIDIYSFELLIFNRWGEVIWENHDPEQGWDGTYNGKIVPTGSYAWIAKVKKPQNDGKETFSGNINLLK